ncbi:hypothetical protein SLA2020_402590 [Shorea laevis]
MLLDSSGMRLFGSHSFPPAYLAGSRLPQRWTTLLQVSLLCVGSVVVRPRPQAGSRCGSFSAPRHALGQLVGRCRAVGFRFGGVAPLSSCEFLRSAHLRGW